VPDEIPARHSEQLPGFAAGNHATPVKLQHDQFTHGQLDGLVVWRKSAVNSSSKL
jgi:hypothetical protein